MAALTVGTLIICHTHHSCEADYCRRCVNLSKLLCHATQTLEIWSPLPNKPMDLQLSSLYIQLHLLYWKAGAILIYSPVHLQSLLT